MGNITIKRGTNLENRDKDRMKAHVSEPKKRWGGMET